MSRVEKGEECRNPFSRELIRFAHEQGRALEMACGIPGARHVLGGALGYDAALVGCYDIDLRLLVPDTGKDRDEVRRQIDSVKDLLAERAKGDPTFAAKFIDEGGTNYIWHTRQVVQAPGVPGDPDIKLTWNVQAESSYRSLAAMASRLPKEAIDRYVVAKWNARQAGDAAYRALKGEWKALLSSLIESGGPAMPDEALRRLLDSKAAEFPRFLGENGHV